MGIVAVTLDAESGRLSENVVFTLRTQDGSAEGKLNATCTVTGDATLFHLSFISSWRLYHSDQYGVHIHSRCEQSRDTCHYLQ